MAHLGLTRVRERMYAACERSGRDLDAVDLLVVSKNRSDEDVAAVYEAGQRLFAENREQGLRTRVASDLPTDITWHFVGPLQSRKAAYVGNHIDLLHSMDRMKLARLWADRCATPVLIQFNLAAEPQKSGFAPSNADQALEACLDLGLDVRGVMAIPPLTKDPEDARPWFRSLRTIFDGFADAHSEITVCSMGMTNDLEVAIEEGSTLVRVGRAIFEPDH